MGHGIKQTICAVAMIAASGAALTTVSATAVAAQENELSFYLGSQSAPHSDVEYSFPGGTNDFTAAWEGRSFEFPVYYGFRYTRWMDSGLGFGVEVNHAKVYADDDTLAESGFDALEFTDGLNIVTANVMYRWSDMGGAFTPYVGGGVGFAMPHVDSVSPTGQTTFEYQITGLAFGAMAGVSYEINDQWSVFGEYRGTYSMNEADLGGGETLSTNIITNAVNLGVTFSF